MKEAIEECKNEIYKALRSSGKSSDVDEIIRITLEILWVTAQKDAIEKNPPKFITLDA